MINTHVLTEMLLEHEGLRLKPYTDTTGHLTIGVGRNLTDVGISRSEALLMLQNDIEESIITMEQFTWFLKLDEIRKLVILDMLFNMGLSRLLGFHRMIRAIELRQYGKAADEMLDSTWAQQVKGRAIQLAQMMRTGDLS